MLSGLKVLFEYFIFLKHSCRHVNSAMGCLLLLLHTRCTRERSRVFQKVPHEITHVPRERTETKNVCTDNLLGTFYR